MDYVDYTHAFVIEAELRLRISDPFRYPSGNFLNVYIRMGGNLSPYHHHSGGGKCFTGNVGGWIIPQANIQHRIAYLIRQLVRMPF
jgi:hypothetical protein